ncbi:MAG: hypothetical protein M2R45_02224 [Verrucomicrobia subdivision 3 bacterium]|nr:hypothetical protein [Limisphaerales bacterium]MCS1413991.1 hypothetical protein [Limisphaerales bacterium]
MPSMIASSFVITDPSERYVDQLRIFDVDAPERPEFKQAKKEMIQAFRSLLNRGREASQRVERLSQRGNATEGSSWTLGIQTHRG